MRAPPPPRKSRSRFFTVYVLRLQQLFTFYKLKKRWNLHKLHALERRGHTMVSPISPVRVEDMVNLPTGLQNNSQKRKPLLIATFPRGCSRSPRVRVLQRNGLSRILISKRKYKLKYFDVSGIKEAQAKNFTRKPSSSHPCAHTVRSIKKATSKNADVRVIFHDTNTIKSYHLNFGAFNTESPEILEFGPQRSIRIKDYSSLGRKKNQKDFDAVGSINKQMEVPKSANEVKEDYVNQHTFPSKRKQFKAKSVVIIRKYVGSGIISYSKIVNSV